jgi:site-specific DNA recombinase
MDDLERQKAEIVARIAVETPPLPDVNPNIAEIYRHKVQHLSVALADPKTAQESTTAIRSLIGEIVLAPGEKRGEVPATLRGELMSILDFAAGRHEKRTNVPRDITAVASSPRNYRFSGPRAGCITISVPGASASAVSSRSWSASSSTSLRPMDLASALPAMMVHGGQIPFVE